MKAKLLVPLLAALLAVLAATDTGLAAEQSPASAEGTPGTSATKPEVTIRAKRADLEPKVSAFVNLIAGSWLDAEGLARWIEPACPLVSGLPPQDGEFILARVSEIARTAGVPLAGEKCKPNLYIFVTTQPEELLRGMDQRNHSFTFGDASPGMVDAFISTPRPVRVWYHTASKTPEGTPLLSLSWPQMDQLVDKNGNKYDVLSNEAPRIAQGTNQWSQATHLSFNAILDIYRVFVIVDAGRLKGISRGQVADYVAMSGLAQLKAAPKVGDAPTILTLFEDTPQAAPAGMSDWDQAFLKSLYSTEQKHHLQRSQIAREMVREIVPE